MIELAERYNQEKTIVLVSKKAGLTGNVQARMFIIASYLLVSNENVILSMADLDFDKLRTFQDYPEYDLNLGKPLGDYTVDRDGLFIRNFGNGIVLVNPGVSRTLVYMLRENYK